jgi:outer membrane protein assembly factor BamB
MPWFRSLVVLVLASTVAVADDWPQWLGPHRDGSTSEKVSPWQGDLKVIWRTDVPEGHSSPVVTEGRVYLHTCLPAKGKDKDKDKDKGKGKDKDKDKGKDKEQDMEVIDCYQADTGRQVWRYQYPRGPFKALFGRGPRATPTVAGGRIYAYGATGILTCLNTKTAERIWQIDARTTYKAPELMFGVSSSPLVAANKVLVAVGGKGASVVAFDKDHGQVLWKSLDDKASYSSPILMGPEKDPTAVFLTQKGLVGLRLHDGQLQWSFPFQDKLAESSTTPVRIGDKLLISSITLGTALVELDANKDGKTMVVRDWFNGDLTCYFSTPVPVGKDHVYLVTGALSFSPTSTLHCIEASSGKVLWKKEGVGKYHASLLRTGNNKLLMVEEAGNLVLIDPDPKAYREIARAKICGNTWAHPAVSNGRLYIRDEKQLICVQLPQ